MTAYLTPTHSAGSVIYKMSEGGRFALLVGDNGYSQDSWEKGLLPGPLYDGDNMRKCLAWVKRQAADERYGGVFCAHDPVDRRGTSTAPRGTVAAASSTGAGAR